jgi:hypothetical protein
MLTGNENLKYYIYDCELITILNTISQIRNLDSFLAYRTFFIFFGELIMSNDNNVKRSQCQTITMSNNSRVLVGFVLLSLCFQCVMFCRSMFALLSFFAWSLYFLFFIVLQLLVTPLVSSSLSCNIYPYI